MAMPPGNGGEINQYYRPWFFDERDGFISWLRGEFAAANAIIDSLCHHLHVVSVPGEYDMVIAAIQQRRCNWNQVLYMQQFFPVSDVGYALQQVQMRQRRYMNPVKFGEEELKRYGTRFKQRYRVGMFKKGNSFNGESQSQDGNTSSTASVATEKGTTRSDKSSDSKSINLIGKLDNKIFAQTDDGKDVITKLQDNSISVNPQGSLPSSETETLVEKDGCSEESKGQPIQSLPNSESETLVDKDGCTEESKDNDSHYMKNQNEKQSGVSFMGKTFVGMETIDGKVVNVVDGLISYEDFLNEAEVAKVLSLVKDLRDAGKKGQLQGQTFVLSKRPIKGHGREMIQLGFPLADPPPEEESLAGVSEGRKVESIPGFIQDIVERLVATRITSVKPDACAINVYNEGDFSQPYNWPHWFGRPICVLFLTECDMTFGKTIILSDHAGVYRGSLKLSLTPGSLLLMQGKSSDLAKQAIPSIRKQRILLTFTQCQPKKSSPNEGQCHPSSTPSHWDPPHNRSPSPVRHQGPKHYAAAPTKGVLPAPPVRPQLPSTNGMEPLYVPAPVAQARPFPPAVALPPGSTGWPAPPPRYPSPHLPVPGTGVFLPPGSGNPASQTLPVSMPEIISNVETVSTTEDKNTSSEDGHVSCTSSNGTPDGKIVQEDCNGSIVDTNGTEVAKDEEKRFEELEASNSNGSVLEDCLETKRE